MLLRRTAVPVSLAAVLVVGMMVGLPWYYKTFHGALPERGLTAAEVEWAGAYAPWRTRVGDTLAHAYANRNSIDGELGRILDEIAGCGDDFIAEVGAPPSERLGLVVEFVIAACARADAARLEYRDAGDLPSWRTSAMVAGGRDAIRSAEFNLRRLMLAQRPLDHLGGHDERVSRIEPVLSDGISGAQSTEVLCWSEEEWPQVQAELAAVGLLQDPALRRDVNAYRFRVNASPRLCDPLVRFAYEEPRSATPEVAHALLALLHAAQHAVAAVEDEQAARCGALRHLPAAAVRLGAAPELAEELAAHAQATARCS
jgi:hypothetical protein